MIAITRLSSDSKIDKMFGFLYYAMFVILPIATWIGITQHIKTHTEHPDSVSIFWLVCLASTYLFIFTNIFTLRDYKNIYHTHKGTIDYYLAKINITQPKWLGNAFVFFDKKEKSEYYEYDNNKNKEIYAVIFVISLIFITSMLLTGIILSIQGVDGSLYFFGYNAFLFSISLFINSGIINNRKVSAELLNEIFEMDEITKEEKEHFRNKVKSKIQSQGFVTRKQVFNACKHIVDNKIKQEQERKINLAQEKYTSFFNRK